MNKFRILWIDDDWDENSRSYNSLVDVKDSVMAKNEDIEIDKESHIGEGLVLIGRIGAGITSSNKVYDLAVIDLNFKNSENGDFLDLLNSIIEKGILFMIYTNNRNDYQKELISVELEYKNLLVGIYEKSTKGTVEFENDLLQISSFRPIHILHLSDLHYDSSFPEESDEYNEQINIHSKLIEFLSLEYQRNKFDYIVFSGDFAAKNPSSDYLGGGKLLRKIVQETTKNFSKLLLVPGNHDIDYECFGDNKPAQNPGKSLERFYKEIFDDNNFISSLSGYGEMGLNTNNPDAFCFSKSYENGLVSILGINSVTMQNNGKGGISPLVLDYMKQKWGMEPKKNEFRIAVFHHNLLPAFSGSRKDEKDSIDYVGEVVDRLTDLKCDLLLTGHSHYSGLYSFSFSSLNNGGYSPMRYLATVSTSTTGGSTPGGKKTNSFNLIQINPCLEPNKKNIRITPVYLETNGMRWKKGEELITDIFQNREHS